MAREKRIFFLMLTVTAVFMLTACGPTHTFSHMTYLADSVGIESNHAKAFEPIVLEKGDRISIKVNALDPEKAQIYNGGTGVGASQTGGSLPAIGMGASSGTQGGSPSYLVDVNGEIKFPQLGTLKVVGLTVSNVADTIQNWLRGYIKEPLVTVELINFQINVLGEVGHPGTIVVPDGKITIIEAISQSGDLTINGLRENILVVRQKDGKRQYGRVNLASKEIFESPYYYLKQGDIVYVEMNKNKLLASDQLHIRRVNYAALTFTAITATAIIYNSLKK